MTLAVVGSRDYRAVLPLRSGLASQCSASAAANWRFFTQIDPTTVPLVYCPSTISGKEADTKKTTAGTVCNVISNPGLTQLAI